MQYNIHKPMIGKSAGRRRICSIGILPVSSSSKSTLTELAESELLDGASNEKVFFQQSIYELITITASELYQYEIAFQKNKPNKIKL